MSKAISPERMKRFEQVAAKRQSNITVVLENVDDPHNIGAVMRSCDAIGIAEVYVVYTGDHKNSIRQYIGNNSSSGAKKWIKVHFHTTLEDCFTNVRKKYSHIYGTKLDQHSVSLYDLNLAEDVALVFGNEKDGISEEAMPYLDGNFVIPQHGMTQSLNISVACAVTLFEALRQRDRIGAYDKVFDSNNLVHTDLVNQFSQTHFNYIPDRSE